jgi:hypothetical protein
MNLRQEKFDYFDKRTQYIAFDDEGCVLESDHTLLDVSGEDVSVFHLFPLMEAIEDSLRRLTVLDKELVYPVVEYRSGNQVFIFDLIFRRVDGKGSERFLMFILDSTAQYHSIMQLKRRIGEQLGLADDEEEPDIRQQKSATALADLAEEVVRSPEDADELSSDHADDMKRLGEDDWPMRVVR